MASSLTRITPWVKRKIPARKSERRFHLTFAQIIYEHNSETFSWLDGLSGEKMTYVRGEITERSNGWVKAFCFIALGFLIVRIRTLADLVLDRAAHRKGDYYTNIHLINWLAIPYGRGF
jgi:hypothetical protein